MHYAVDCDDVIVDFWTRVQRCYKKEFGEDVAPSNDWGDNPIKNSDHFGPGKAYETWWDWWRDRHWLWATCDAVDGAIGGLAELHARGHYVELVTHKPEWARKEMTEWLAKWHPYFDQLTLVDLDDSKAQASAADVLIDDKPKNVRQWVESGRQALLFTQPWNWGMNTREVSRVRRVDTWQQILDVDQEVLSAGRRAA